MGRGERGFLHHEATTASADTTLADAHPRYFRVDSPVQLGSSGGLFMDGTGAVIGVVATRLNRAVALRETGALPKNVTYAVRSSVLAALIDAVPGVRERVLEADTGVCPQSEIARRALAAVGTVSVFH